MRGFAKNIDQAGEKKEGTYIFGLFLDRGLSAIEGVSEAEGQLPQWLILRLPIHVGAVQRQQTRDRRSKSASGTASPAKNVGAGPPSS